MLESLNTYRSFFYSLFLLSYLLSVFQTPVFELAHLLSHAAQLSPTHSELHSYGVHHVHDHHHNILALLDDSTTQNEDHSTTKNDLDLKKKVEINTPILVNTWISLTDNSTNFGYLKKPCSLYQKLIVPPPQLS